MKRLSLVLLALGCAAQISGPQIGFVRDLQGNLRQVFGVAGAFVTGDPIETGVLSASFSASAGLVKKDTELTEYRKGEVVARRDAPEGPAACGFTASGEPDWVRFANDSCMRWKNGEAEPATDCPASEQPDLRDAPEGAREPESMGAGWISVRTDAAVWAIRTEQGREAVYRLPEGENK